jgi:hypothetical protein
LKGVDMPKFSRTTEQKIQDTINMLSGYAKWTGKTPSEMELLNAIKISIATLKETVCPK